MDLFLVKFKIPWGSEEEKQVKNIISFFKKNLPIDFFISFNLGEVEMGSKKDVSVPFIEINTNSSKYIYIIKDLAVHFKDVNIAHSIIMGFYPAT